MNISVYCIVDMHAITIRNDPETLRRRSLELAQYVASGLDPERNIIYIQSHVPQHAELLLDFGLLQYAWGSLTE